MDDVVDHLDGRSNSGADLVVNAGAIVTMDESRPVIFNGHVEIRGGSISRIGRGRSERHVLANNGRVLDKPGFVAMPGLVDLHFHTGLAKGYCDNLSLRAGIRQAWYPLQRSMTREAVFAAAMASYVEAVQCGVTTVNDMYHQIDARAAAADAVGVRAVLASETALEHHGLDLLQENAAACRRMGIAGDRITACLGIEAVTVASLDMLQEARDLAKDLGCGIHIHLNESRSEVVRTRRRFGRSPIQVAHDCGILGRDTVVAHCVCPSEADVRLIAESGASVAHCPISNSKLGVGISPVVDLRLAGINVGLGHDSVDCGNVLDLFQVMRCACLLQRATRQDAGLFSSWDLLSMATKNGAAALGLQVGQLSEGYRADLILLDMEDMSMRPRLEANPDHLLSHLAFAASGHLVDTAIIHGQVVMEGHELVNVDVEQVARDYDLALERMLEETGLPREGFH